MTIHGNCKFQIGDSVVAMVDRFWHHGPGKKTQEYSDNVRIPAYATGTVTEILRQRSKNGFKYRVNFPRYQESHVYQAGDLEGPWILEAVFGDK